MCCRTVVRPLDIDIARAILAVGQFRAVHFSLQSAGSVDRWERAVAEEAAIVIAHLVNDGLELSISPAISAFEHHAGKRIAAGVYFEIAARYAEKVGGLVVQRATVEGCTEGQGARELLLASYPSMPLSFDRICNGFRATILGEGQPHAA